jgi:hypothetical protein
MSAGRLDDRLQRIERAGSEIAINDPECSERRRRILFYLQDSETKKSVLRQHQRRAIDAVDLMGSARRWRRPNPSSLPP